MHYWGVGDWLVGWLVGQSGWCLQASRYWMGGPGELWVPDSSMEVVLLAWTITLGESNI